MKTHALRFILQAFLAAVLAALLPVARLQAATSGIWPVTRSDDPVPSGCLPGDCSLREAVLAANTHPGPDVIQLTNGHTYVLSIAPTGGDNAASGDLNLTDDLSFAFTGPCFIGLNCGATIKGGAAWADRIFAIFEPAVVQMRLLTIENGGGVNYGGGISINHGASLTLTASTIMSNSAESAGGIFTGGQLTLDGVTLSHNTATVDGGGGLETGVAAERLNIFNSTITANQAQGDGGGLVILVAATLSRTTLSHNHALTGSGGGLYFNNSASLARLTNMTIVSNTAPGGGLVLGGGIADYGGDIVLSDSTVGWNSAACGGGIGLLANASLRATGSAVLSNQADNGGGVCGVSASTAVTLTNVTVDGNQAFTNGGGLLVSSMGLYNVTLTHNRADSDGSGTGDGGGLDVGSGQVDVANSILAYNSDLGGDPPECFNGVLHSLGNNLIMGASSCLLTGITSGNKPGANPQLLALGDNGGPTWTEAFLSASPAHNAGNLNGCRDWNGALIVVDQRGSGRWDRCDMGAFELRPAGLLFLPLARR